VCELLHRKKTYQSFQVTSLAQLAIDRDNSADITIMTMIHDSDTKLFEHFGKNTSAK
jgi:hypothetical protein